MIQSYKNLKVWEKAHQQVLQIYLLTKDFPEEERFGIFSQMRRAAVSVTLNIIEGKNRGSRDDFKRFLYNSRGSNEEVHYLIYLSYEIEYINKEIYNGLVNNCEETGKMINGLINSLKKPDN